VETEELNRSVVRVFGSSVVLQSQKTVRQFGRTRGRELRHPVEAQAKHMAIERFEDLKSWQEARKLMQIVYRLTQKEAFKGDRALTWQIREAAVSSMGNIAEAHGRYSFEDKRRLFDVALGSCKEIQSHLYVALDQGYADHKEFDGASRQADMVGQLINGAINNLDRQIAERSPGKSGPRRKPR